MFFKIRSFGGFVESWLVLIVLLGAMLVPAPESAGASQSQGYFGLLFPVWFIGSFFHGVFLAAGGAKTARIASFLLLVAYGLLIQQFMSVPQVATDNPFTWTFFHLAVAALIFVLPLVQLLDLLLPPWFWEDAPEAS